ncbi:MAG: hypothetical protein R6V45_12135 [Oceanipulchritudo sp.]
MNIVSLPLTEILFFVAAFFAPENVDSFTLEADELGTVEFVRVEDGWANNRDNNVWSVQGLAVVKQSSVVQLQEYVAGADTHDWCKQSVLRLHDDFSVLRDGDQLSIYPDGLAQPDSVVTVSYGPQD